MIVNLVAKLLLHQTISTAIENKNKKQIKAIEEQKIAEQRKKEEEIRIAKQKERDEELELFRNVYDGVEVTIAQYFKRKDILRWVMDNKIIYILNDLPDKRLIDAREEFDEFHKITSIGPFELNKKQVAVWYKEYLAVKEKEEADRQFKKQQDEKIAQETLRAKRKIEAKKERIANQERAKKKQRWLEYVDQFKKYNKAQQQSELDWFKKKLVDNFASDQDEKELLIHQLEMLMLEDEK